MLAPHAAHAKAPTLQQALGNPADVKISGSVRVRYEALDGQFRPGFDAKDDLWSVRTTLAAEWNAGPVRIGGELYDSRAYDTDSGSVLTTGEVNTLEMVQAYLATDIRGAFGKGSTLTLQAGRFTMNLGSRRLVAADDYRNTTSGYTGFRADLQLKDRTSATLFYTLPQQRLPESFADLRDNKVRLDREDWSLRLFGALVSRPIGRGKILAELGYVRLQEFDRPSRLTRNRDLHSISARVMTTPAPDTVDLEVEGIYQSGSIRSSAAANAGRLDVEAWFVHADAGYTFRHAWKPRLSIEYDRASGDGPGRKYTRFDTLFGMRRSDLAPSGIYAALGRTNVETVGLRAEAAPSRRLDMFANARALWAASRTDSFSTTGIRDATGRSGRFAGYQVEGRVRYWIVPDVLRAELNAAWLARRALLDTAPNAPGHGDTHYGVLSLTTTF
ncbi:hypothetical protein FHS92_002497 [Sphingobium subterraneum]|uniref:Alginate export domain-containing protein n=2 Tax=Sphingobium subterraneum TaxID=627688 RepID=A0A841J217_9SPHN|nr:hypothetical protein [Sphingobium subterraneum]